MSRGKIERLDFIGEKRVAGFSLLEVLIALFILSFSLLTMANFTTVAWRRTYDAYLASLAVGMAANRIEAAYAQDDGKYSSVWQKNVAAILPHGLGSYTIKKDNIRVKVCWQQLFHKNNVCYIFYYDISNMYKISD